MNIHTAIEAIQTRLPDDPRDAAIRALGEMEQEIFALRQQLATARAQTWQPVRNEDWQKNVVEAGTITPDKFNIINNGRIIRFNVEVYESIYKSYSVEYDIDLDEKRVCRLTEPQWLDAPDSVGWWAFSGTYTIVAEVKVELVKNILEWNMDDEIPTMRFQGDMFPMHGNSFRELYSGKWLRLNIAWEDGE